MERDGARYWQMKRVNYVAPCLTCCSNNKVLPQRTGNMTWATAVTGAANSVTAAAKDHANGTATVTATVTAHTVMQQPLVQYVDMRTHFCYSLHRFVASTADQQQTTTCCRSDNKQATETSRAEQSSDKRSICCMKT
ncbi:unnamed protein product [Ceratitis capitata]|uniref:(Mediterranean fruit fly) hypothetical protein n=1 Tax=Ceratitis capitata TaxID=7213 RepID=A0A811VC58_CERCA|nr:unnamed protein product [Ceratitis capitata]